MTDEKRADGHVEAKCTGNCNGCMFCHGGLFACTRCDGFEGAMPSQCPGVKMTQEQRDTVYAGDLDYRDGRWVKAPSGSCSSHYDERPGLPKEHA